MSAIDPANIEPTQSTLILRRLQQTPGKWVAMPDLYRASGAFAVHSRISELRSEGHHIEAKLEGSRPRHSYYRLIR